MITLQETFLNLTNKAFSFETNSSKLTESDTIRVLILPVLRSLGWDLDDLNEVRSEYRHRSTDNPVDYALFIDKKPVLFVEAKAFGISLDDRKHISQAVNYANTAGVKWCILSNGKDWRIYNAHAEVDVEKKLFFNFTLSSSSVLDYSKINLLSKDSIALKEIDIFWKDFNLDEKIKTILNNLFLDEDFINFLSQKTQSLDKNEIINALKRIDYLNQETISFEDSAQDTKLIVNIKNHIIFGSTVSELYQNAVTKLIDLNLIKDEILPFATGKKRYLISKTPFHPNNVPFFKKKQIQNYYIECNKSRASAPQDMQKLIDTLLNPIDLNERDE